MDDDHLPRWSGPIVGAALGLLAALAVDGGAEPLPWHWRLVIGLALGTGSGILIALIDPGSASRPPRVERFRRKPVEPDLAEAIEADAPEPRAGAHLELDPGIEGDVVGSAPTLGGRFLALVALAVAWAPLLGLCVSLTAVLANQSDAGWPRRVSLVALALSWLSTAGMLLVFFLAWQEARG